MIQYINWVFDFARSIFQFLAQDAILPGLNISVLHLLVAVAITGITIRAVLYRGGV